MKLRLAAVLSVALCVAGAGYAGKGMWIYAKAVLAQILLEKAWTQTLAGEEKVKPWPWADTWPVVRIEVRRLGVDVIVLSGDSGRTLAFGPGHTFASAFPGETGTSVISGHRDTHFRFLKEVEPGDEIVVGRPDGVSVVYAVAGTEVIDARKSGIGYAEEGSTLALVTCWPFDAMSPGGPMRYLVTAERKGVIAKNPA